MGTHHCDICRRCVNIFSHHSEFYNRCIGEENHLAYITVMGNQLLLLSLYFARILIHYWDGWATWKGLMDSDANFIYYMILVFVWMKTFVIIMRAFRAIIMRNLTVYEYIHKPKYISTITSNGASRNLI